MTDPAAAGEVCLRAWKLTGQTMYREATERMLAWLLRDAPRTPEGILCHVLPAEGDSARAVWVDSMYMAPPFLAVMGETGEALRQLNGMRNLLIDPGTGLLFHMYDAAGKRWLRKKRWATGNGWALMGMARVHDALPQDAPERGTLVPEIRALL